ncbi:MAG: ribosome-binding factor A [Rickettsiales bacterium]|jgi:ribosome-binding factor A|nr:ribosome-binding factor A [Rickettsiales bacterium]
MKRGSEIVGKENVEKTNFQLRRSSKLKKVLNDIFAKSSFTFADRQIFANVLRVDISRDLINAKVFIDVFGASDRSREALLNELNNNLAGRIRNIVAKKMRMKFVPKITFYQIENMGNERRIFNLLEISKTEFDG